MLLKLIIFFDKKIKEINEIQYKYKKKGEKSISKFIIFYYFLFY
jgi:hypothetical protein